jgi:UPF0755 protein
MTMRRRWKWVLAVAALLLLGLGGLAWWFYRETRPLSQRFQPQLLRLREPLTPDAIAQRLAARHLIRNPRLLALYLRWRGKHQIAPGDYEFSPNQNLFEIARILIEEQFTRNWVTIPEGWNRFRIAQRLHERGIADRQEFLTLCRQPERFRDIGLPLHETGTLEGYLFPSTYRLPPGSGAEAAIRAMLDATRRYVYLPYRDAMQARGLSLHEVLTIASMIEKEAMHDADRPLIAAVIYNRLKKGMPLQIDATVLYGMGQWKSRVLYKDLQHPSPYNTYRRKGLPPGPIANPGLASIRAALNPTQADYLFYVAQADGYHRFTRTYEEHLQAIREIRSSPQGQ